MWMKLTGIHHSSVVVTDMARARRFYGELLGLPEVDRPANFETPVVWFEIGDQHIPPGVAALLSPATTPTPKARASSRCTSTTPAPPASSSAPGASRSRTRSRPPAATG